MNDLDHKTRMARKAYFADLELDYKTAIETDEFLTAIEAEENFNLVIAPQQDSAGYIRPDEAWRKLAKGYRSLIVNAPAPVCEDPRLREKLTQSRAVLMDFRRYSFRILVTLHVFVCLWPLLDEKNANPVWIKLIHSAIMGVFWGVTELVMFLAATTRDDFPHAAVAMCLCAFWITLWFLRLPSDACAEK